MNIVDESMMMASNNDEMNPKESSSSAVDKVLNVMEKCSRMRMTYSNRFLLLDQVNDRDSANRIR